MTAQFVGLLDQLRRRSLRMASLVEDIFDEAWEAVFEHGDVLARRALQRDEEVDAEEIEVEAEVIRLMALYQPVGSDLRLLCTILKVNNDLERIADCAVNVAERARHLNPDTLPCCVEEVRDMQPAVRRMLQDAIIAYGSEQLDSAQAVLSSDERVDALYARVIQRVVGEAAHTTEGVAACLDLLSVAKNLERIADHATNIAEDVIFLATGRIVRHGHDAPEP